MRSQIKDDPNRVFCAICKDNKRYKLLGAHIRKHGYTAREYKTKFELPYAISLIAPEIEEKKNAKMKANPTWEKNFLKGGTTHQFKKGQTRQRRISTLERSRILARIDDVNKARTSEKCPVCQMIYDNLDSHLANAHKLLRIKP